jgi:hypothetical protein
MPCFYVSDTSDKKQAVKDLAGKVQNRIELALKRSKVASESDIEFELESIRKVEGKQNELRQLLGLKPQLVSGKQIKAVKEHLEARLKRYHELNTPEMIAKRAALRVKKDAKKQLAELARQAELITKFRNGESTLELRAAHELLRIKGDVVQTSRGAEVPLCAAKLLLKAIHGGHNVVGSKIGDFEVFRLTPIENDVAIRIGCHEIMLSEANNVLGGLL